jgi:hypothetical protein
MQLGSNAIDVDDVDDVGDVVKLHIISNQHFEGGKMVQRYVCEQASSAG